MSESKSAPIVMVRQGDRGTSEQGSTPAQRLAWLMELTIHSCRLAGIDPDPKLPRDQLPGRLFYRLHRS